MNPTGYRFIGQRSQFVRLGIGATVLPLVAVVAMWLHVRPANPGVFYQRAYPAGAAAGMLVDKDPFTRSIPTGARGWRFLYTTTRAGKMVVASAIALLPEAAGPDRAIVAWAHGTTGIVDGCAPSVLEKPFDNVPDVAAIVRAGWAYVGADYPGLGTSGGHSYLVGEDAAHAVLDAARAARQLPDARMSDKVVVWGHSQGGNAALWSGMRAGAIAPELRISGIAAFAPASDLKALVASSKNGVFGKITSSYLLVSYARAYPDVIMNEYTGVGARMIASDLASRCIEGFQTLFSAYETKLLPRDGIFSRDPTGGPLGARLEQNTPTGAIPAPLLIAQGDADDLVLPAIQKRYVVARCAAGQPIEFRSYAGRNHISLVSPDSPLASEIIEWTRDRFEGKPAMSTCAP